MYLFEELNKMGTTVVIATHNEGLVGRFTHRQLRIANGTVRLVDPAAAMPLAQSQAATQPQIDMRHGTAAQPEPAAQGDAGARQMQAGREYAADERDPGEPHRTWEEPA